jgi:HK97 family phage major capsid protein
MSREIIELLQQQGDAFEKFKGANLERHEKHAGEIERLEKEIDELVKKGRPGIGWDTISGGASHQAVKSLGAFVRSGDVGWEMKALTEDAASGGIVIPHEMAREIAIQEQKYSPLRSICNVVSIKTAASKYIQPVMTSGPGVGWVGETDARPGTTVPTLDAIDFPDAEVYANLPVTAWFDEDQNFGNWIVDQLAQAFARAEGAAFVGGDGTKKPKGVLAYPKAATADGVRAFGTLQTVKSGAAAALTADGLIDLLFTLSPGYRANAHWVMNSTTLAAVRKLKDPTTGSFLWSPSIAVGQPSLLLGHPVVEAQDMPDVAGAATPIMVGDFKRAYTILDRSVILLRDPYTSKPLVNIYSRKRVSGALVDSNAVKLQLVAAP